MKITCIIPTTFNQQILPLLSQCIESLFKSAKLARIKITIMVVSKNPPPSNFNQDKQLQYLKVKKRDNSFSRMNNIAIEKSLKEHNPDYFLLINDDAWVKKNFFQKIKELVKSSNPDVISPIIYKNNSNQIDSYGVEYFRSGYAKNAQKKNITTTIASASCIVIKSSLLIKIHKTFGFYFNPLLQFYVEDVELLIRARVLNATITKSQLLIAYHAVSSTSGKKSYFSAYLTYRNVVWTILMTWPLKTILRQLPNILLVQIWEMFISSIRQGPRLYLKIFLETYSKRKILIQYRNTIISNYPKDFNFSTIFSSNLSLRTNMGFSIRAI